MRLVSIPAAVGEDSRRWPVNGGNISRRKSLVTPTKVKLAVHLAIRHRKFSAAIH